MAGAGEPRKGTGRLGSLRYSSNASPASVGGSRDNRPSAAKWSVLFSAEAGGQASKRRHSFVPVWKTRASGSGGGAAPLRGWAKKGNSTLSRDKDHGLVAKARLAKW